MSSVSSQQAVATVIGHRVKNAVSSLENMAIEFEGGVGLLVTALASDGQPAIGIERMTAEELPRQPDAVCSVDWSWIENSAPTNAAVGNGTLKLQLDPAGPLTISVQFWQGKPFLAFQPYKASR